MAGMYASLLLGLLVIHILTHHFPIDGGSDRYPNIHETEGL
jgi:hypothetical protein